MMPIQIVGLSHLISAYLKSFFPSVSQCVVMLSCLSRLKLLNDMNCCESDMDPSQVPDIAAGHYQGSLEQFYNRLHILCVAPCLEIYEVIS